MERELWSAYDAMGPAFEQHAADGAYNAHYDRPAEPSSALRCPTRTGGSTGVVWALAIHYADDRGAAFAEFFRVLRPGGAAVVSVQHPVMDWLRKGGSYFGATLETDTWRGPFGYQPVRFWREPLPAESMRERYPDDYRKLTTEPGFLILRLVKLAGPQRP